MTFTFKLGCSSLNWVVPGLPEEIFLGSGYCNYYHNYQNFVVGNSIDGNSDDDCNHCSNPHEKNSLKDYCVSLRHLRRMVTVVGGRTWLKGDLLV